MANEKQSLLSKMTGSNAEVLAGRAGIVNEQARLAQVRLIDKHKGELNILKLRFNDLTDLAPTNSTALKIETKLTTDPDGWVAEIHELQLAMALKEDDIAIAQATYDEWFPSETITLS